MSDVYTEATLSPMQRAIAARVTEAKATIPHFRLTVDIAIDALLEIRKSLQRDEIGTGAPTLNAMLVKASAKALMDEPSVNIQWAEGVIRKFSSADISVVIAHKGGLSTPIIRGADSKSLEDISREIKVFMDRAAQKAFAVSEIVGGSFTVSNLGMYGIDQFDAVINPPQCAILALGSAKPRVVASLDGQVHIATTLRATLSADHRAIDGVKGASFLGAFRRRIEEPAHLLEH